MDRGTVPCPRYDPQHDHLLPSCGLLPPHRLPREPPAPTPAVADHPPPRCSNLAPRCLSLRDGGIRPPPETAQHRPTGSSRPDPAPYRRKLCPPPSHLHKNAYARPSSPPAIPPTSFPPTPRSARPYPAGRPPSAPRLPCISTPNGPCPHTPLSSGRPDRPDKTPRLPDGLPSPTVLPTAPDGPQTNPAPPASAATRQSGTTPAAAKPAGARSASPATPAVHDQSHGLPARRATPVSQPPEIRSRAHRMPTTPPDSILPAVPCPLVPRVKS